MDVRLKLALPERFAGVPASDALCLYFVHLEKVQDLNNLPHWIVTNHITFIFQLA